MLDLTSRISHGEEQNWNLIVRNKILQLRQQFHYVQITLFNGTTVDLLVGNIIKGMKHYQIVVNENELYATIRGDKNSTKGDIKFTFEELGL